MEKMKVRITFTEQILGTASNNPDIHREFIAKKAPDAESIEEEVAAIGADEVADKGMTVFPRMEDGTPFLWDYQVKGFFKDACSMLRRTKSSKSFKLSAHRKVIDGCVFVRPRKIPFVMSGEMGDCQRPLRAQTAQGERIALAESETVPAGSTIEFEVVTMADACDATIISEWLNYGAFRGLGQWRNAGNGTFEWELLDSKGKVIGGNKA